MGAIQSVLESLGYQFVGSGAYKRCKQYNSLVINTDSDLFYWNSKNIGGNIYQFLTKIEMMSKSDALNYLHDFTQIKPYKIPQPKQLHFPSKQQIEYLAKRANYYYSSLIKDKSHIEYWYKQGINEFSIHKFKLGWAYECPIVPNYDSFTIPYLKGKDIINIRHRLNVNSGDKYRPEIPGISNYLFNVNGLYRDDCISWPGDAVLLEGEKKAMVFDQHGFRATSIPGANAWDNSFLKEFNNAGIDFIYVLLDPGMEEQSEKIAKMIRNNGKHAKAIFLPDKPDDFLNAGYTAKDVLQHMR